MDVARLNVLGRGLGWGAVSVSDEELFEELGRLAKSGDVEAILKVVRSDFWRGFDVAPAEMLAVLGQVPDELLTSTLDLAIIKALCGSMTARSALLGGDRVRPAAGGTEPGLIVSHLSRMIGCRLTGDFHAAADIAESLRERLGKVSAAESEQIGSGAAVILLHTGLTALLTSDTLQAISDFRGARSLGLEENAGLVVHDATAKLSLIFALRGSVSEAEELVGLCPPINPMLERFTQYSADLVSCLVAVERMDADAARRLGALDIEDPVGELWPLGMLCHARYSLAQGLPEQALELMTLMRAIRTLPSDGLARDVLVSLTMDAYRSMNQISTAARIYELEADRRSPLTQLAYCRLLIRSGRLSEAEAILRDGLSRVDAWPLFRDSAGLNSAWIAVLRTGRVPMDVAKVVQRTVLVEGKVRLATDVPFEVHQAVAEVLPNGDGQALLDALAGLTFDALVKVPPRLSSREMEVIDTVSREGSVAAAAAALFVSHNTVKTHLCRAYSKLGVHSLDEAVDTIHSLGMSLADRRL